MDYFLATSRGAPFHFSAPTNGDLWQESMPIATGSYTTPTPVADARTYGHEQRKSIESSKADSTPLRGDWTSDSIGRTTSEAFAYDWDSVFPGYRPKDADWEDPQPLVDSPPNLHASGYYMGPTMSRLIAGAGQGEEMGDVEDPWGTGAPNQLPAPPQDRTDQLIQQVALLCNENHRLQQDVTDL